MERSINRLRKALREAQRVAVLTGAGVSAEGGIPTFRGADGLHGLAGSRRLLELHGSIWQVRCTQCGRETMDRTPDLGPRPTCAACGGLLRPGVVWFGESLDPRILRQAAEAAERCQVMLVVGTSSVVQPAASLALTAKSGGGLLVEINLERTPNSDLMDMVLVGKAAQILPMLVEDGS